MDKKTLGKRIQKYRERSRLSQESLAEKIECSAIFISYIERGEKAPGLDTLIKLSNELNVSVDILLGKELKGYTNAKLHDIEISLKGLPSREQYKILEVIDAAIMIELNYYNEKDSDEK